MNTRIIDRREWIRSGVLAASGLLTLPYLSASGSGPEFQPITGEWLYDIPDENKLKARLLANENPYGPSEKAKQALVDYLDKSNLYSFGIASEFRSQLAESFGVKTSNMVLSAGSSEILILCGVAFGAQGGEILSAFPSFETVMRSAAQLQCNWKQVPLNADYVHDLERMEKEISADTRLVYVCNPNNPTGTLLDPDELREFCLRVSKRVPVFVDEAYNEFLDVPESHSMVELVRQGENIIVCRTFSKVYGFAGLRIGYAIASDEIVKKLGNFRWRQTTMNGPSIAAAMAAFNETEFTKYFLKKNKEAVEYTYSVLEKLGYKFVRTHTNFMIFPIEMEPDKYLEGMRNEGVGVRSWSFNDQHWCRVSIGTVEEMQLFGEALAKMS